jgi:hypothetical protein
MKTVTTGFLFWKATEVTTLATSIALLGLSPVLLPAVTSVALAGGGWMLAGRLSHRQQQKRWRSVFAEQFQRREQELHAWADEVLALEQH